MQLSILLISAFAIVAVIESRPANDNKEKQVERSPTVPIPGDGKVNGDAPVNKNSDDDGESEIGSLTATPAPPEVITTPEVEEEEENDEESQKDSEDSEATTEAPSEDDDSTDEPSEETTTEGSAEEGILNGQSLNETEALGTESSNLTATVTSDNDSVANETPEGSGGSTTEGTGEEQTEDDDESEEKTTETAELGSGETNTETAANVDTLNEPDKKDGEHDDDIETTQKLL